MISRPSLQRREACDGARLVPAAATPAWNPLAKRCAEVELRTRPMNSILRLIIWVWSIGWLRSGAAALSNGEAARSWISFTRLAAGIADDELLGQRAVAERARRGRGAPK
jgi:hypothetical protein